MIDNIYGVVIQIGLHKTTEFAYLGYKDWYKRIPEDKLKQVPDVVQKGVDYWRYIGVDACPKSITGLLDDVHKIPSAVLINACITGKSYQYKKVDIFRTPPYFVKSITISFDDFLTSLSLDRIDILAIDIEGDEVDLLLNYSFRIRPYFITVESHERYYLGQYGKIENHLLSIGYKVLCSVDTNQGNTREYQFIDTQRR